MERVPVWNPLVRRLHVAATVAVIAAIQACGGGSNEPASAVADAGASAEASEALAITLDAPRTVAGNRIQLSWKTRGRVERFDVMVQRQAGAAFEVIPSTLLQRGIERGAEFERGATWQYDFPTARVRVQACGAAQACVLSNDQPLLEPLLAGMAQVQPVAERGVNVRSRVAISADARTMAALSVVHRDPDRPGLGAALVFERAADGTWSPSARVDTFDVAQNLGGDGGAMALSADGNTLAIGANQHRGLGGIHTTEDSDPAAPQIGAVYVFIRDAQHRWSLQAILEAAQPAANAGFGSTVAMDRSGNRVLVGGDGGAYVFDRSAAGWRQSHFRPRAGADAGLDPRSETALSGDGTTMALHAFGTELRDGREVPFFAVRVYRQCACGDGWRLAGDLRSIRPQIDPFNPAHDGFGETLSFSHDGLTLAVGARDDSPSAASSNAGAVYIFGADRGGTNWQRRAFLQAGDSPMTDTLGAALALSADGTVLAAKACGYAANTTGLRRNHRADAALIRPPGNGNCNSGGATYFFEQDAQGSWRHTAAALLPSVEQQLFDRLRPSLAMTPDAQTFALGTETSDALNQRSHAIVVY